VGDESFLGQQDTADLPTLELPAHVAQPYAVAEPAEPHAASDETPPSSTVVVEWPEPEASRVLAVRLIAPTEKFSGRAVRMALAAEGFVLGKLSIFHKPAPDGRALLSVASLTKPGTFDSQSIDLQRFSGLNLFTVLPGPVSGQDAAEEMLECAQVLAQRLRGTLQDDHGAPLGVVGTALIRSAAAAASP
jgi:FtsZ-interacting cell division protein ZipA